MRRALQLSGQAGTARGDRCSGGREELSERFKGREDSDDRAETHLDELDWCEFLSDAAYREIAAKYGINRQDGQFFFNPTLATGYFAFNHDRPAFKGPGQIPLMKAINWAIDRPALVRASGYLGGKRTDQILPPAIARNASIYPLGGVTGQSLARARALLAKARFKPTKLVLYAATSPAFFAIWAQIFQFNMKRLGIDVETKYFGSGGTMFQAAGTRGARFDVMTPLVSRLRRPERVLRPAAGRKQP